MKRIWEHFLFLLLFAATVLSCTQPRTKRYSDMIDPLVGSAKKEEVDRLLGVPAFCRQETALQKCEYRTASGRNAPTPEVFSKKTTIPDVSPYEYFDVIHLFYDDRRVLKEWQAVVVKP
jgi:hypothetical protein